MADELKTIPIKAPRLNQPGYGSNIEKVFENIDTNFRIVGNHDFVKGNTGNCVGSKPIRILNDDRFTQEGMSILNAIIQQVYSVPAIVPTIPDEYKVSYIKNLLNTLDEYIPLKSVRVGDKEISLIDGFTNTDIINLITLYDPMYKEDTEKPIGATNDYLFRDPRFVYLVDDTQGQYSSLYDCSCTVHMQLRDGSEDFVCRVIQNAPTLYYDSAQQTFCWRIGGRETGIIAQGPSGKSGVSAFTYIVRVGPTGNSYGVSGSGDMREIKGYVDPKTATWDWSSEFPSDWTGSTCLALSYSDEDRLQGVYVSIISENNTVFCNDTNNLPTEFDVNYFMSAMAQINAAGDGENRGLFIPMGTPPIDEDGKMNGPLHAIWSTKNPNDTTEASERLSELHISPLTSGMAGVNAAFDALKDSGIYTTRMSGQVVSDARLFADYNTIVLDGPANQGNARLGIGTDDFKGLKCGILMKENSEIIMPKGTISASDGLAINASTTTIDGGLTVNRDINAGNGYAINILPAAEQIRDGRSTKQIYCYPKGQNLRIWNPENKSISSAIQLIAGGNSGAADFKNYPASVEISSIEGQTAGGSGMVTVNGGLTVNRDINAGNGYAINICPVDTNYSTKQIFGYVGKSSQNLRIWNPNHPKKTTETSAIQLIVGKPDGEATFDGFPAGVEISTTNNTQEAKTGTIKMSASSTNVTGDLIVNGVANLLVHGYKSLGSGIHKVSDRCFYIYRKGTNNDETHIHFYSDVYHAGDIILIYNDDETGEETYVKKAIEDSIQDAKLDNVSGYMIVFSNTTYKLDNKTYRAADQVIKNPFG